MHNQQMLILDFGSQYTQLIARRIRELNVYCEIHPYNNIPQITDNIKGVIFSGSPFSVRDANAPVFDAAAFIGKIPVLGVCFGAQYLAYHYGGQVSAAEHREYGRATLSEFDVNAPLFEGVKSNSQVWMSHADTIVKLPPHAKRLASSNNIENAAFRFNAQDVYGLQFHPEVYHSEDGKQILKNFVVNICACAQNWTPEHFVQESIANIQQQLGNDKVVMGLSGGVDSSVAAMLIHRAIGKNLYCIFVDNGLLRKNEFEEVLHQYKDLGLNIKGVNAADDFYEALAGIEDPEKKRKAIGNKFIDIFDREAHEIKGVSWLGQGTIYPDVIESISVKGPSATIKSHHNVGGLPDFMKLKLIEPLNTLFKDEVRLVGHELELPAEILNRHPFPGPGLGIRILGDITKEKVRLLQEADKIYIDALKSEGLYDKIWQAGSILLPVHSVGVMGDERTYEKVVALRAVNSTDGMTADWYPFTHDFLAKVSNDIINKVKGINRVVYDVSSKPPATIEWE